MGGKLAALVLALALNSGCGGIGDGTLCVPLPPGWFGSAGPGVVEGRPAAWLLAGNFRFPGDAASHEATPPVPAGRVLLSVGDFPPLGQASQWRRVERLRLPHAPTSRRAIAWHVRFTGRALWLSVRFGSRPTTRTRALVNARLGAVRRTGRASSPAP